MDDICDIFRQRDQNFLTGMCQGSGGISPFLKYPVQFLSTKEGNFSPMALSVGWIDRYPFPLKPHTATLYIGVGVS